MRKALFFLGILDDGDISWMISTGKKRQTPAGTVLIHEGRAVDSFFIVLDGRFSVSTSGLGHKEIAQLMCGEVAGEISFVDARPPLASVRALEQSCVLAIPKQQLAHRLDKDSEFAARFYRALAVFLSDRLRSTVGLLGYGQNEPLQEREYSDEIAPELLDKITLAGARFDWLQRKLRSI